jgi:hypothetical protein
MSASSKVLLVAGLLTLILFLAQLFMPLKGRAKRHEFSHNFAQSIYGTLAAVAIVVAAYLYIVEKQWESRFSVDLKTRSSLIPGSEPPHALVQAIVAVRNHGRTDQTIKNIEIGAWTIDGSALDTNTFGDIQSENLVWYIRKRKDLIRPGEIDLIPIEIAIPCSEKLVRILVKVPQPNVEDPVPGERQVYERKTIVALEELCSGKVMTLETPFHSMDLELGN